MTEDVDPPRTDGGRRTVTSGSDPERTAPSDAGRTGSRDPGRAALSDPGRAGSSGAGRAEPDSRGAEDRVVRRYRSADRDALYRVCLLTGGGGQDATSLYERHELLGQIFVGPYLELQPEFAFVVDDGAGAEGYVLGALDTSDFAARCEERWWPRLRAHYRDVTVTDGYHDDWLLRWIADPPAAPAAAADYPSHLHIDLLPRWQRGGWGRRLIERLGAELSAAGSPGVHLGVSAANANAQGFYEHLGFRVLERSDDTIWMGRALP